jgi:hypothetical protein
VRRGNRDLIPIGNYEAKLAAVCESPVSNITKLLSFRNKSISVGDLNAKHPCWNSALSNSSCEKFCNCFMYMISKSQRHRAYLTPPLLEMVMYWVLLFSRISESHVSLSLISWTQITYQYYSTYWIMLQLKLLEPLEKNQGLGTGLEHCL